MKAQQKVEKAQVKISMNRIFYSSLMFRLPIEYSVLVPTMGTDGKRILVNEAFADTLSQEEIQGVIVHEIMHVMFHDFDKRLLGTRDKNLANIAMDLRINPHIRQEGLSLPEHALFDDRFDISWTWEKIYDTIKNESKYQNLAKSMEWNIGGVIEPCNEDGSPLSDAQKDELKADWQVAVNKAAQTARVRGTLPASLEQFLGELNAPKQDWKSILRDFIQGSINIDYTWSRPNRRYPGTYLPASFRYGCGEVVLGFDTSGSVSAEQAAKSLASEAKGIFQDVCPDRVYVLYCDAAIQRVDIFEFGEEFELHWRGGGGTDFKPVFKWVEDNNIRPECLVYLTDTYGDFPDKEPPYPVLWASYGGDEVPWGRLIKIDE